MPRSRHVARLWAHRRSPQVGRLVRYAMVSVVTTSVALVTILLLFGVGHVMGEVAATITANCLAMVPGYYLNRAWVWGKSGRSHLAREVVPFFVIAVVGLVVSTATAAIVRHVAATHHLDHATTTVLVLVANLAAYGIVWVGKFLLFNRLFAVDTLADLEHEAEAPDDA